MTTRRLVCSGFAALTALAALAVPASAQGLEKFPFRLNWTLYGEHAPFFVARDKGFYKEEGLDVEIAEGSGSTTVAQLVANQTSPVAYVDAARAAGVSVPIVPGILPFRTADELRRFTTKYARTFKGPASVPEELEERLLAVENDNAAAAALGIEWATRQCRELLDLGAPGIHFYCMNKSSTVETILRNLQLHVA